MGTKILVCLIAGIGAGFGTGLAGMSAAAVISPMLITFLGMEPYQAIGIALASDVLASAASAYEYRKNGNIDVRNGLWMLASVLVFTLAGSWISSMLPQRTMGSFSMVMTIIMGVKFLVRPVMAPKESNLKRTKAQAVWLSLFWGMIVGLICGFVGAGGGMMMLMVLVMALGYGLKTAVGTSVFIMTFTALTGAISHFAIAGSVADPTSLILCIVFTLIAAQLTAKFANKADAKTMNRMLGIGLLVLGLGMMLMQ